MPAAIWTRHPLDWSSPILTRAKNTLFGVPFDTFRNFLVWRLLNVATFLFRVWRRLSTTTLGVKLHSQPRGLQRGRNSQFFIPSF